MSEKDPWSLTPSEPPKQNPWNSWENEPARTTAPQPYAAATPTGAKQSSTAKTVGFTLLAVLALGLVGSGSYLAYSGQLSSLAKKDAGPEVVTITETVRPSAASQTGDQPNQQGGVTTVVQTVPQVPAAQAPAPAPQAQAPAAPSANAGSNSLPSNMYEGGWRNVSNAQCASGDKMRFGGRTGSDYALICTGSRGTYYQGYVDGGAYSSAINSARSNPSSNYYVVPADPATIIVTASEVRVEQNGSVLLRKVFTETHGQ